MKHRLNTVFLFNGAVDYPGLAFDFPGPERGRAAFGWVLLHDDTRAEPPLIICAA